MKLFLPKVVYVFLAFLLVACGSVTLKTPRELAVDHGMVVGSIHTIEFIGLELKSYTGDRQWIYVNNDMRVHREIEAWLPAGQYQITKLISRGVVNSNIVQLENKGLPTVNVSPGKITDLNHLVPVNLGGGKYALLSMSSRQVSIPKAAMENPELLDTRNIESWSATGPLAFGEMTTGSSGMGLIADVILAHGESSQRGKMLNFDNLTHENAFDYIKQLSPPSSEFIVNESGTGYFGTTLGQVRFKQDGKWGVIDTGYVEAVVALDVIGNKLSAVVLESGDILEQQDSNQWVKIAQLPKGELAFDIRTLNGVRYVSTKNEDDSGVGVYKLIESKAVVIKKVPFNGGIYSWTKPIVKTIGSDILIAYPPKTLIKLNPYTGNTKEILVPKKFTGASYNGKNNLLSIWLAGGGFSKAFVSSDMGESWKRLPKPPFQPTEIYFESTQKGYMWSLSMGLNSTAYKLDFLDSDKNDWNTLTKSDISCTDILSNFVIDEHYCVLPNGGLQTYKGGRWYNRN